MKTYRVKGHNDTAQMSAFSAAMAEMDATNMTVTFTAPREEHYYTLVVDAEDETEAKAKFAEVHQDAVIDSVSDAADET